jgi:hypothetical protein
MIVRGGSIGENGGIERDYGIFYGIMRGFQRRDVMSIEMKR